MRLQKRLFNVAQLAVKIDRFTLLERIGIGGMGEIYAATANLSPPQRLRDRLPSRPTSRLEYASISLHPRYVGVQGGDFRKNDFHLRHLDKEHSVKKSFWPAIATTCVMFAYMMSPTGIAHAQDVGILRGSSGCPAGSQQQYVHIDNEDTSNVNSRSGWLGASISDRNTTLEFCRVSGAHFAPVDQAYMVLALDPDQCPFGSMRIIRRVDSEDTQTATHTNIPWILDDGYGPADVLLNFCAFPPNGGSPLPYNPFPNFGVDYGVFASPQFTYALPNGHGYLYMDDQNVHWWTGTNEDGWCESTCSGYGESRNYWDILTGGYNTDMSLALVRGGSSPPGALIPFMSSGTTPSGIVTRSGVYSSAYEAWQAFDATTGTLWLSNMYTSSVWFGYEWGGGTSKTVTSYQVKYANGSCCQQRGPKNWTLQGWNGSTWVTVSTVTNQTGWYANPIRTFAVATPGSYSRYRLHVTADNYNNATYPITLVSIATLQLYGY